MDPVCKKGWIYHGGNRCSECWRAIPTTNDMSSKTPVQDSLGRTATDRNQERADI